MLTVIYKYTVYAQSNAKVIS